MLTFSSAHDNDLLNVVSALGLYEQDRDLPATAIQRNRTFKASEITPMGGRIILERLVSVDDASKSEVYVRININDGILALHKCDSGPERSCPLEHFIKLVQDVGSKEGDFAERCALDSHARKRIEFLHQ